MLCVTYSAVLQILEIRPLLCSRNVNEFLHRILYGIKWLFLINPYETIPSTTGMPSIAFMWSRANQFREGVCAQECHGN